MIRVGVFHDQTVFRIGLELLIEEEPDMRVVSVGGSSPAALGSLHVVVLGGSFGRLPSIRTTLAAARRGEAPAVIALADYADAGSVEQRLRAGAKGVVASRASPASLTLAIRSVAAGSVWCDPGLESSGKTAPEGWRTLTRREKEVAELVADGLRYDDIATRLGISGHTVRNHSRRIFDKLDIGNRVELAAVLADAVRRR